jgi:hypothetical protein
MPKVIVPIRDTDETVLRPVITGVVKQILEYTELKEDDVQVFFPGTENKTFQPGSSINKEGVPNQLKGAFYNQVAIEVDEQYEHDRILATAVFHPENLFIFRDDHLETSIKPVYSSCEVTINIRFRALDKVTAIRWRDQMRSRISRGRITHLHTLVYSYFIPGAYMEILKEIHRLRENVAGYGQDWDTYFKQTVSPKATIQTDMAGKNQAWSMAESQMRVIGYFDYDGAPEQGGREDGGETWTINLAYKFKYDKPVGAVMMYPLVIHNQLLDQRFRPKHGPYEVIDQERAYAWSTGALSRFEMGNRVKRYQDDDGVCIPSFDEWYPSQGQIPNPTARIASVPDESGIEPGPVSAGSGDCGVHERRSSLHDGDVQFHFQSVAVRKREHPRPFVSGGGFESERDSVKTALVSTLLPSASVSADQSEPAQSGCKETYARPLWGGGEAL